MNKNKCILVFAITCVAFVSIVQAWPSFGWKKQISCKEIKLYGCFKHCVLEHCASGTCDSRNNCVCSFCDHPKKGPYSPYLSYLKK